MSILDILEGFSATVIEPHQTHVHSHCSAELCKNPDVDTCRHDEDLRGPCIVVSATLWRRRHVEAQHVTTCHHWLYESVPAVARMIKSGTFVFFSQAAARCDLAYSQYYPSTKKPMISCAAGARHRQRSNDSSDCRLAVSSCDATSEVHAAGACTFAWMS